jgi:chromosome segregation protein
MYLEDITIEGFKSFSEKTDMSFQPGISVIIGNNGVGKSNILDAIVWALGESDLNRIRCYSDEELFFAGSKEYPPANFASVALTLKQSEKDNDSKTELCRQMDRDGTQRYFIGDKPCTPDEYRTKLASLNLNHALKTIIRQEQINDILLQNPEERLETICTLLGIGSLDHFRGPIEKSVAELFSRYMSYLIPDAAVRLEVLYGNSKKGIDAVVTLPGNRVRRSHQLSGGEKAVTSLALKLAIFSQLRNPFFLLDEVEPSLDYTHHKSIQAFLRDVSAHTQLVMITHLRSTIELADTLHGVRTRRDGSSFMKFFFNMDERLLRLYKCC